MPQSTVGLLSRNKSIILTSFLIIFGLLTLVTSLVCIIQHMDDWQCLSIEQRMIMQKLLISGMFFCSQDCSYGWYDMTWLFS
jgi:hypothetical protein